MIITQAPFRISLLGGGTDYPEWYLNNGGMVVGGSIDKYGYISLRSLPEFFPHKTKVVYSRIEECDSNEEIEHGVVREALKYCQVPHDHGMEIHYMADLPAKTGIGSSSTFTVALIHALKTWQGIHINKDRLVRQAIHLERNRLHETVGTQDQTWAAYGGVNQIHFRKSGDIIVDKLPISLPKKIFLESSLLLCFTGYTRRSSEIASTYVPSLKEKRIQLSRNKDLAEKGVECIMNGDMAKLGSLMTESWNIKKSLSPAVTNDGINEIYDYAMELGAFGGKLTGAGGGGFLLFVIPSKKRSHIKNALREEGLLTVDFQFEYEGSRVIYYDPSDVNEAS